MIKLFRTLLAAIALSAVATAAQATLININFDAGLDTSNAFFPPLMTHGDALVQGDYFVGTYSTKAGAQPGDFVGALVDGNDVTNTCFGLSCPTNNATQFLAMLDDGLPALGRLDGGAFRLLSFDASFIGASGVPIPPISMLLRVVGFTDPTTFFFEDVLLSGPVNDVLSFNTFGLSDDFSGRFYTEVGFYGYACDASGNCSRTNNTAQFGIDNITVSVPEPSSMALFGLGLAGLAFMRRRRNASV